MAPAAISADNSALEIVETLTPEEERDRHRLELRVERAFYQAGLAIKELRDRRLYRSTHSNDFVGYCRDRFGKTKQAVNYLIAAAEVYGNLTTTNCCRVLPTSVGQVRSLSGLEKELQVEVWQQAVDLVDGKVPSGRIVKGIVEQMKEKPLLLAKEYCQAGDVFTLTKLEDSDRKYNGYPCVAIELKQFTICVDVHDTTLTVKPENLQKLDSPEAHRQLPQILMRIKRLRQVGTLDRGANHFLTGLGKQVYLTEVEEMLLSCLEAHYKVEDCNDAQATT
ncbi:hypothetical protein C7B79_35425 [Chroococcidiopsis cubana CCALA 043]|nr:hypothetical protein C7B79_35425 [Chroococcidiopsis cubana CCALA 043]